MALASPRARTTEFLRLTHDVRFSLHQITHTRWVFSEESFEPVSSSPEAETLPLGHPKPGLFRADVVILNRGGMTVMALASPRARTTEFLRLTHDVRFSLHQITHTRWVFSEESFEPVSSSPEAETLPLGHRGSHEPS
ncbi:hypothetical protein AVEN_256315-1 [Araneus ventricosus]|uniref:Uncharacterized protein n=1 Tax=Araneus ventricosus TaxID=182803 RepID=A0A4Y2WQ13_ARAVE|nr:hypothetical protein AVEN_256315-1 [Araneus ventricosus]